MFRTVVLIIALLFVATTATSQMASEKDMSPERLGNREESYFETVLKLMRSHSARTFPINDDVEGFNHNSIKSDQNDKFSEAEEPLTSAASAAHLEIISQTLSTRRPFVAFQVRSNRTLFRFEADKDSHLKYYISVVVEKMSCRKTGNRHSSPKLHIEGEKSVLFLCSDVDNSLNGYQSVSHLTDDDEYVNITGLGDWSSNVSASLVASIYYEASDCHHCSKVNHFCCGTRSSACESTESHNNKREGVNGLESELGDKFRPRKPELVRCIPHRDDDERSILCNGHPNCGLRCNPDELSGVCEKGDSGSDVDSKCVSYYCREYTRDRVLITILLLVLFCVFVPFCIFLVFCTKKEFRRDFRMERGRCPLPLEILFCPFSVGVDSAHVGSNNSSTNPAAGRTRTHGMRRDRDRRPEQVISAQQGVPNLGYFDDLPPSYTECCNNKALYPSPPKFSEQIALNHSSRGRMVTPSTSVDVNAIPTLHQSSRTRPSQSQQSLQMLQLPSLSEEPVKHEMGTPATVPKSGSIANPVTDAIPDSNRGQQGTTQTTEDGSNISSLRQSAAARLQIES